MKDIILTWPKKRTFESYLMEVGRAWGNHEVVLFKVASAPQKLQKGARSYMVHDGAIRGWLPVEGWTLLDEDEKIVDEVTQQFFAPGIYIVRDAEWHPIEPIPMKGFRGFRYTERHCSVCHTMAGNLIEGACYDCCKVCTICNENPAYPSEAPICESCDLNLHHHYASLLQKGRDLLTSSHVL